MANDFPSNDSSGTNPAEGQDNLKTSRELPTMRGTSPDDLAEHNSATLPGVDPPNDRIVLQGNALPGYDLLGELGRGGMGVVYKARDQKLKRIVALKMILSGAHASDEDMQRFQTEAEAVARLQHPNIVQVYEVAEHDGHPYIALEFAAGGSLDQKIAGVPQNIDDSAQLVQTLCRAMEVAHQNDIIHRDLKPANILLTSDGDPKITDFGLAKRLDEDSMQTKSGTVIGTPSYMPPEQAANTTMTLGPPADVYALGAILYHLLTGRPPFQAETQLDTIMQVITEEPVSPRKLNSSLPVDLETITLKCLQKEIPHRYQSAASLADDLQRFQAGEPIQARPISLLTRGWKWSRRRPAAAGLLGVSAVALLILVVGGLWYNARLQEQKNEAIRQQVKAEYHQEYAENQERIAKGARLQAEKKTADALHADYIATINLVDQDLKTLNYQSAQLRIQRFDQRITPGIPDPRGIEWKQLANVAAGSFIRLQEASHFRITSFDATPSADVVLYNIDWRQPVEEIPDINQLRIYDAVQRRYLSDEALTHPALERTSRDGPIIRWISGRTFVIGNPAGLFSLTVRDGLNETVAEDIKLLAMGKTYEITRTGSPGEFIVASIFPEDAASPVIRVTKWQLNEDEAGITFTPGETSYPLDTGENANKVVTSMAVSPDRRYLAVGRAESVIIRDFTTGELLSTTLAQVRRNTPDSAVKAVTFLDTSNGVLLAIAGHNKIVEIFQVAGDGRSLLPQRQLQGHRSFIQGLSYDRESGWLLSASNDRSIFCWSPLSGERHFVLDEHEAEVINVAFTDRGRYILSASFDSSLVIRERGRVDRVVLDDHEDFSNLVPASICFLPKTRRLLISGSGKEAVVKGSLTLMDWDNRTILDTLYLDALPRIGEPHPSGTFAMVPLLSGELVRCGMDGDSLQATTVNLGLENNEPELEITRADSIVHAPALDCFYMILQTENDTSRIARIDGNGRTGRILALDIPQRAFNLAVSPDGDQLAIGTGRGDSGFSEVYLIQTGDTETVSRVLATGFPSSISSIQFHPDGNSIYLSGDQKVIEHHMLSRPTGPDPPGTDPGILYGHFYFVQKLGISRSGRRLISLGADGLLCLWDLESGEILTKREFTGQRVRNMAQDHAAGGLLLLLDNQIMVLRH